MLEHQYLEPQGILVLQPDSAVTEADVAGLQTSVTDYLATHADIKGLLIDAPRFPGYEGLGATMAHIRFVAEYHKKIERVALVTDTHVPPGAEFLAKHFVGSNIRHFPSAERAQALKWLES